MIFADDDLKQLKEGYCFTQTPIQNVGQSKSFVWCDRDKIFALIYRLEVAEKVCERVEGNDDYLGVYVDWLKAAGK